MSTDMSDITRLTAALRADGLLSLDERRMNMTVNVDVAHLAGVLRRHGLLTDDPEDDQVEAPVADPDHLAVRSPRPEEVAAMFVGRPANQMGSFADRARELVSQRRPELHLTSGSGGTAVSLRHRADTIRVMVDVDRPQDYDLDDSEVSFTLDAPAVSTLRQGLLHDFGVIDVPARGGAQRLEIQLRKDSTATAQVKLLDGNAVYVTLSANAVARLTVWVVTGEVHPTNEIAAAIVPALAGVATSTNRARTLLRGVRLVPPSRDVTYRDAYLDRVARHATAIGTYAIGVLGGRVVVANPGETLADIRARWGRAAQRAGGAS